MTDERTQEPVTTEPVDPFEIPIGTAVPHGKIPDDEFPPSAWGFHTVESWAKAFLASLLDDFSRPPRVAPGHTEIGPQWRGITQDDVRFTVLTLEDGHLGVAATTRAAAEFGGGRRANIHHLLRLDIKGSPPPPSELPPPEE